MGDTVTVTTVALYDPIERPEEEAEWAADYGERQLVRVDTNYKPTRLGQHSRMSPDEALRRYSAEPVGWLLRPCRYEQLAWALKPMRALEADQLGFDLLPGRHAPSLVQAGAHLIQRIGLIG